MFVVCCARRFQHPCQHTGRVRDAREGHDHRERPVGASRRRRAGAPTGGGDPAEAPRQTLTGARRLPRPARRGPGTDSAPVQRRAWPVPRQRAGDGTGARATDSRDRGGERETDRTLGGGPVGSHPSADCVPTAFDSGRWRNSPRNVHELTGQHGNDRNVRPRVVSLGQHSCSPTFLKEND